VPQLKGAKCLLVVQAAWDESSGTGNNPLRKQCERTMIQYVGLLADIERGTSSVVDGLQVRAMAFFPHLSLLL
jgi:hypothetical protein